MEDLNIKIKIKTMLKKKKKKEDKNPFKIMKTKFNKKRLSK